MDENSKLEPDCNVCLLELVSKQNSNKFRCSIHFSSELKLNGESIHSIDQLGLMSKQLHSDSMHPVDQLGLLLMHLVALMGISPAFIKELEQLVERFPVNDHEVAV